VQKKEVSAGVTNTYRYAYNAERRLTDVTVNAALLEHFEYDANGNRTLGFDAATGTTSTGTYDAQDRQASYGPFDFTYTANGELATKTHRDTGDEWVFDYDALGNLLSVGLPNGDLIEYLVDGTGRRVGKLKNGVLQKRWLYRDALSPVAELDASGALVSEFVYASKRNTPDYVRRGGVTYRVISDALGSPRLVVNVANVSDVPFRAAYTSFGDVTGTGLDWMPLGFAGGIFDVDTRLLRFGARDYSPSIGRWLTKDPERFRAHGANLYAYCSGDPVNRTDPSGLDDYQDGQAIECSWRLAACYMLCSIPEPAEPVACYLCVAETLGDPNGACQGALPPADPPPPIPPEPSCPRGQVPGGVWADPCIPDDNYIPNSCEMEAACDPRTQTCPHAEWPL
jgi:RHS repeat-associated protein